MGLFVIQLSVGGYDDNFSYLIVDETSKNTAVVDPCGDLDLILETVEQRSLDLVGILITHNHFDHTDQLAELLRSYSVPVYAHVISRGEIISSGPIHAVEDGDGIPLGSHTIKVLHTPGHIADAVCYLIDANHAEDGVPKIISGDTLFVEGCGRTNAYGVRALYESLQTLKALPDETEVYPGHDYGSKPFSTIAWEKERNKYFLVKDFEAFKELRLS